MDASYSAGRKPANYSLPWIQQTGRAGYEPTCALGSPRHDARKGFGLTGINTPTVPLAPDNEHSAMLKHLKIPERYVDVAGGPQGLGLELRSAEMCIKPERGNHYKIHGEAVVALGALPDMHPAIYAAYMAGVIQVGDTIVSVNGESNSLHANERCHIQSQIARRREGSGTMRLFFARIPPRWYVAAPPLQLLLRLVLDCARW